MPPNSNNIIINKPLKLKDKSMKNLIEAILAASETHASAVKTFIKKHASAINKVQRLTSDKNDTIYRFAVTDALIVPQVINMASREVSAALLVNGQFVNMNVFK